MGFEILCFNSTFQWMRFMYGTGDGKAIEALIRNMSLSKKRTLTEGGSFINNGPLGFPGAIRISKNCTCKHFVIWFTAITVTPIVLLIQKTSAELSFYLCLNVSTVPSKVEGRRNHLFWKCRWQLLRTYENYSWSFVLCS